MSHCQFFTTKSLTLLSTFPNLCYIDNRLSSDVHSSNHRPSVWVQWRPDHKSCSAKEHEKFSRNNFALELIKQSKFCMRTFLIAVVFVAFTLAVRSAVFTTFFAFCCNFLNMYPILTRPAPLESWESQLSNDAGLIQIGYILRKIQYNQIVDVLLCFALFLRFCVLTPTMV